MNKLIHLTKVRLCSLNLYKIKLVSYGIVLGLVVLLNLLMIASLNSTKASGNNELYMYFLILINGLLISYFGIVLGVSIFRTEISDNIVSWELREGYSKRDIFLSRIFEVLTWFSMFMIPIIVINMITIGSANQLGDVYWYKVFVINLGWYAIIFIISTCLAIFISTFGNQILSSSVSAVIMVVLILVGFVGSMGADLSGNNGEKSSINILQDVRDSNVSYFMKEKLKLNTSQNFSSIESLYQDKNNYKTDNDYENAMQILNHSNQKDTVLMMFGDSLFKPDVFKNNNVNNEYIKFIKDTNSYFNQSGVKKYKYKQISNWDYIDSPSDAYNQNYIIEPINEIINDASNSDFGKEYSVLSSLKKISSAKVLNDLGLYPVMYDESVIEGNKTPVDGLSDWIESINLTPAEMMFNKYISYLMNESIHSNFYGYANDQTNDSIVINDIDDYRKQGHKTLISMIYNPWVQFSSMMNGVDYKNELLNNTISSWESFLASTTSILSTNEPRPNAENYSQIVKGYDSIKTVRKAYPELVYVGYFVANVLLVFAGFWIYKKTITE